MNYTVIFEPGPKNWSAYVPDLPGCIAAGATREETAQLIREAIALHIEALREDGEEVPGATSEAELIAVPSSR
jgi:predicted RNase H-like HicB family nuclease